jgi:hypothetical protein
MQPPKRSLTDGSKPGATEEGKMGMEKNLGTGIMGRGERTDEVPGIVIAHGGWTPKTESLKAGLRAFVYGEKLPASPTLPFGRWKRAS